MNDRCSSKIKYTTSILKEVPRHMHSDINTLAKFDNKNIKSKFCCWQIELMVYSSSHLLT